MGIVSLEWVSLEDHFDTTFVEIPETGTNVFLPVSTPRHSHRRLVSHKLKELRETPIGHNRH